MDWTELMSVLDVVERHEVVTIAAEERMRWVRRRRRETRSMLIDTPGRLVAGRGRWPTSSIEIPTTSSRWRMCFRASLGG